MTIRFQHTLRHVAVLWQSAFLAAAALCLTGCHEANSSRPTHPVVKTMPIALDRGAQQRTYSGVIVARHEVQESFRVGGRIEKRLVDVGDPVREGQILAVLDEKDLRLAMESAQVVLMKSDPYDVVGAIELSRATLRKMHQNLWWAVAYNVIAFPLAAGVLYPFTLSPEVAALSMSGSSAIVAINALDTKTSGHIGGPLIGNRQNEAPT